MSLTFEFPEGYTLEKCFADFDIIAEKEVEVKMQEAQEKNRIVTPAQVKSEDNPILMP